MFLASVRGLDVSPDGSVVVSVSSDKEVLAHNTTTGEVLWRKKMPGRLSFLHIHGGVVAVPVENSNTVVLDVATGHQLHVLPAAGEDIGSICVFDGLIREGAGGLR